MANRKLTEEDIEEMSTVLIRRKLGALTFEWAKRMTDKEIADKPEDERKTEAKSIRYTYEKYLKDLIDCLIWIQLKNNVENATSTAQRIFLQGTLNGMYLIKEEMEDKVKEAMADDEEGRDKNKTEESAEEIDTNL